MASLEVMTREEYKAAQQRREKRQKYYKKRNKLGDKVVVYENMEFDMQEVAIRKESRKVDAILTEMHGDLIEAVDEMRAREKAEAENNAYYGEW